jgi:O-antigen/teichoic acid export membrane protein
LLKNIFTVLSGSILAQALGLLALPVLTRLYSSHDFGRFQVYFSCLNVLMMVAALRYELALLVVPEQSAYEKLLKSIVRVAGGVFIIFTLAVVVFGATLDEKFMHHSGVVYVLPVALLIAGFFQTMTYLPMRNRNYSVSAVAKVIQSAVYVFSAFIFAWSHVMAFGLIVADLSSRLVSAFAIVKKTPETLRILTARISGDDLRETLVQFQKYPMITFPGTLISALSAALIPLVFASFFGLEMAGQYALVDRFILAPVAILAGAIMQVFTGELSENARSNPERLNQTFRRAVVLLAAISILPCVLGYYMAPALVPFVFGSKWMLAGQLCSLAMPVAFVSFVSAPVTMTIVICQRQLIQFSWELFRFAVMLAGLGVVVWGQVSDPLQFMRVYVVAVVLSYIGFLCLADYVTASLSRNRITASEKGD